MIIDNLRTTRLGYFRLAKFLFVVVLFLSGCSSQSEDFMMGKYKANGRSFYLEFSEDGTYTFGNEIDNPQIQGQYRIEGQTITFHSDRMFDSGGVPACGDEEGSYTWFLKDNVLVMDVEDESCSVRKGETNGFEYVLIE